MNSLVVGIGFGIEPIPFYLANKVKHVYATDLYGELEKWNKQAPSTFLEQSKKICTISIQRRCINSIENGWN